MSGAGGRPGNGSARRLFLEPTPPRFNHLLLTGTLTGDPRRGRSPKGETITVLDVVFPVFDPEKLAELWIWARAEIEAPGAVATPEVWSLTVGDFVLAAGQLSERGGDGSEERRNVLLATFVHPEPPPETGLVVVGEPPDGPRSGEERASQATESARRDCEGVRLRRHSFRRR